jgi:hypothetical protein
LGNQGRWQDTSQFVLLELLVRCLVGFLDLVQLRFQYHWWRLFQYLFLYQQQQRLLQLPPLQLELQDQYLCLFQWLFLLFQYRCLFQYLFQYQQQLL